ncbi:MAG: phosphatase PAP2 family protein [Pirellulaceae bacterium]
MNGIPLADTRSRTAGTPHHALVDQTPHRNVTNHVSSCSDSVVTIATAYWQTTLYACSLLLMCACLALPFDVSLAQLFEAEITPGELRAIFSRAEFFGHAYGVIGIAVTIWILDPQRRARIGQFVLAALGAGLAADGIKLLVWRIRPCHSNWNVDDGSISMAFFHYQSGEWDSLLESANHSFPSAHTAVAFAAAMVLAKFYPQARSWFWTLAIFVLMNRIDGGAHYLSDVFCGGVVGLVAATAVLRSRAYWRIPNAIRMFRPSLGPADA